MELLLRGVIVAEAVTFLVASALHLGVRLPLLGDALGEPLMPQAGIPEGVIGLVLAAGAAIALAPATRSWATLVAVHVFALAGVLVGTFALAAGAAPRTEANELYHRVILVVLLAVLAFLWTPQGKRAASGGVARG